jgi:hypothetical protein
MARRCLLVLSGLLLVTACFSTPNAQAACVAAVVVDGTILFGEDATGLKLPRSGGKRRAVVPACNDAGQGDPDTETTVVRLEGVPANAAVRSPRGDTVYLAAGSSPRSRRTRCTDRRSGPRAQAVVGNSRSTGRQAAPAPRPCRSVPAAVSNSYASTSAPA